MLSLIVAKAKNNIIGKDNKMIWQIPNDLKRFNELTEGHVIIMGRKTFEGLGNVLPNRKHIVFTNNLDYKVDDPNVQIVHSMLEIKQFIDDKKENFVIGGAMIYALTMPYVKKMYITEINEEFDGDTFFPKFDTNVWKEVSREQGLKDEQNNWDYQFVTYKRIENK